MQSRVIRIGTRSSPLAQWQANWVATALRDEGARVELVPIATAGDVNQTASLLSLGGVGVFVKELQAALLDARIDVAVHSLKDLPTIEVAGLVLAAVPPRGPVDDVLISLRPGGLAALPPGARVGTGSARRKAFLLHRRSDLAIAPVRGNVDTRLRKLHEGAFEALVLAKAGLERLGVREQFIEPLDARWMLPAVGQGALGLECRGDDHEVRALLAQVDDPDAHAAVRAERALLAALTAGCLAPVGAWGRVEESKRLRLTAAVASMDGARKLEATAVGAAASPEALGRDVAGALLDQGAAELIAAARTP